MLIEYVFSAALASEPGNPAGFKQAMESAEVEGWKGGIITEFQNFDMRKVYKLVPEAKCIMGRSSSKRDRTSEQRSKRMDRKSIGPEEL